MQLIIDQTVVNFRYIFKRSMSTILLLYNLNSTEQQRKIQFRSYCKNKKSNNTHGGANANFNAIYHHNFDKFI